MIQPVKGQLYENYYVNNLLEKENIKNREVEIDSLDKQKLLDQLEQYTYSQQEREQGVGALEAEINEAIHLVEEELYELYKSGMDLEELSINELIYRSKEKIAVQIEEEKEKEGKGSTTEKVEVIKKENDNMYLYALNSKLPITINHLYESNFKGEFKKGISNYTKEDVTNVLAMNGLPQNKSNLWATDLLMMYDMGVTAQSINKLQGMQSAVAALDVQSSGSLSGEDELIKGGAVQYQPEYVERITDDLGMVTDEHIEKLVEEGKEISIAELRESIHKNASESLRESKQESAFGGESPSQQGEQQVEEVKKQIEQIRTKLTVEAAQKISERMPLESSQLAQVAEELIHLEQVGVIEALKEAALPVSDETITNVIEVLQATQDMKIHFMESVQIELRTEEKATLQDIQSALMKYEAYETPVELRFGESVQTVENQIEGLLEGQGIEVTSTHVEAAKALITNGLEINAENLQGIYEVVTKLNTFLEEMTPLEVASFLKEGINPYKASVNELLAAMSKKKIEGLKNSVAETIVDMEQKGQISETQKEGMIGVYRILQAVDKQKEEVMGYLFRNELPLTLENLEVASKYVLNKKHINVRVDDEMGEIEHLVFEKETAKQLIEQSESNKSLEIIEALENMSLPITEENVNKVSRMSALLYPYIKEQFKNQLGKFEGIGTLPESFLSKLESVQNVNPEIINQMFEQHIPLTLSNIYWMDQIMREPGIYSTLLDEKGMLKEGLPDDLKALEEDLLEMEIQARAQKEEAIIKGEVQNYRMCKQIEEVVRYQRQRIEKEGVYQIPFMIDGERKLIHLYLHKEDASSSEGESNHLKASITYETKHLGTVKAYLEMKGENIGYKVEAEREEGMEKLEAYSAVLMGKLNEIGYKVQYSDFMSEDVTEVVKETKVIKDRESKFEEMI